MKKSTKLGAYVLLPIIILLSVIFLLREQVSYFVLWKVAEHLAGREGISLEIGGIEGDLLSKTTIRNLSVRPVANAPQTYRFKAASISCTYNLWDLQKGLDPFLQGSSCTSFEPEFSYDFRVETPEEESGFFVPAVLPGIDITHGSVILTLDEGVSEFQGINGALRSTADTGHKLRLATESLRFRQGEAIRIETGFTADLRYKGNKLSIVSLEAGEKEIKAKGFFDFDRIAEGYTEFALDVLVGESSLELSGVFDNQFVRAQARSNDFDVGELQKRLGGLGWDISGRIRGNAELVYDFEAEDDYSGSFRFDVQECRVHGVDISPLFIGGDLAGGALRVAEARAATSGNRVTLRHVSIPIKLLEKGEVFPILDGMHAEFMAEINDGMQLAKLLALDDGLLPEGSIEHSSLVVEGGLADGFLRVKRAEAKTPGNNLLVRNVSVPAALLQGGEVLPLIGGTQGEFEAEIEDPTIFLTLFGFDEGLLPAGLEPHSISVKGRLAEKVLHLDKARADATDLHLEISQGEIPVPGTAKAFASLPASLTARVESAHLQQIAGLFTDREISGRAAMDMTVTGSLKEARADIKLSGEELGFEEVQLGSLSIKGDIQIFQEKPGDVKDIRFTVTELAQTNNGGRLTLRTPVTGKWQPGNFTAGGSFLVDDKGEVSIKLEQSQAQGLAGEISVHALDSNGWLTGFIDEPYFFHDAEMEAVLAGLPQHPQVGLSGSIGEAGMEGMPFPVSGRIALNYSSQGVEIKEFVWKSHGKNELSLTGFLPYDPKASEPFLDGELKLNGHIDIMALEDIAVFLEPLGISSGSGVMDIGLSGTWKQPVGHVHLKAQEIEVPDKLQEYFDAPLDVSCELEAEPGLLVLHSAVVESGQYAMRAAGSWQHGYTFIALLQKHWADLGGEVTLDASLHLPDLNFLKKNIPGVHRIDGDTEIKIHMAGPASAPSIKGSFFLKDGEISHSYNFPMLSAVNLEGEFDRESLTITRMEGEAGGSPVSLNGSIRRVQEGYDVNLQLDGKNLLLLRNNYMLLRGDVQLKVSGPLERLVVGGTTGLTVGYYTKNIDFLSKIGTETAPVSEGGTFLFSFDEPPLKNAVLNIKISTIEPFQIRNNLMRGTLRPELYLKGTGELPFLVGEIYIDPSRVLLPSGRLQIESGLVRFLEKNPDRPLVDLVAKSKVLGYDINIIMQGPLDEPVYTLSSSPALANDDLLLLLLTGQPPKEESVTTQGSLGRGATNVMVYLGRDFLTKWLGDESWSSEESILDRFELDYGRAVTKSGDQTIESTFRLSQHEVGRKMVYYLSGEKDRYDAYNIGFKVNFHFE